MLLQLRSRVPNVAQRVGQRVTEAEVRVLLTGDCEVYKPNGEPLVILRRGAIPTSMSEHAIDALRELKKRGYGSDNRSKYAGLPRVTKVYADGTRSKQTRTRDEHGKIVVVASSVVGYFDRQGGRFPFCRETSFVGREPEKWSTIMPMVEHVAALMKTTCPERYAKQLAQAARTPRDYVIGGTPFTTLTVNNSVAGTIHTDKGDYKGGIGIISVVRRGGYAGGWLVFPEYGVAADLHDGDVIFFNSHDWHGVTEFRDTSPDFERISVVYYFREHMVDCLPPAQELARARERYGNLDALNPSDDPGG